jgi:hypothetical protein
MAFDPKLLVSELNNAQAKREALERQLLLSDHPDVAVLHPQAAAAYRQKVVHLQEALGRGDAAALEAVALVRGMVCEIRVTPARGRMELDVVGDLAALLEQEQGPNKRDFISGCGGLHHSVPNRSRGYFREGHLQAHPMTRWIGPPGHSTKSTDGTLTAVRGEERPGGFARSALPRERVRSVIHNMTLVSNLHSLGRRP